MGYFLQRFYFKIMTDFTITFFALMVKKTFLTPLHRHNSRGRVHISLSDQIKSCVIQIDQSPGHQVLLFHNPSPHIPIPSWPGPVLVQLCFVLPWPVLLKIRSGAPRPGL